MKQKKIKVSELTGAALDWAVCIANGLKPTDIYISNLGKNYTSLYRRLRDEEGNLTGSYMTGPDLLFSRKWEAMGPIIEREGCFPIKNLAPDHANPGWDYLAKLDFYDRMEIPGYGPTPLIAAARCYVTSKLGYTAEVPEELT